MLTKPKDIIVFAAMLFMLGSAMGCSSPTINENKNQSPSDSAPGNAPVSVNAKESNVTIKETNTSESAQQQSDAISDNTIKPATNEKASDDGLQRDVSSIKGKVSDVEGAIKDLGGRIVGDEIVIELPSDILFDFDKYNIRTDAASALEKVLMIINSEKATGSVRIEGHTDSIATDAYNQALSERRAASIKAWLDARGIVASRMNTRGFGESRPKVSNAKPDGTDDPEGRQKNRRVEIFISKS